MLKSARATLQLLVLIPCLLRADTPRALPPGELPNDSRLGPLRGEQGDFNMAVPASPDEWKARAAAVRRSMLVSLGLWPMPSRTPLNPVIHGRLDRGDHTVEKVYFESLPGFFVTGNLYRPMGDGGKRPAVLSPHGHFPGGRFIDEGAAAVQEKIASGAEEFADGGRSFMQARCVQLARMGCVVFHYDMIGYGDSQQIPESIAHLFPRSRIEIKEAPRTGFYSAAAELRLQGMLGLHTFNSIRALDFLCGLPDVDPERIAVTGGSGGGTQTFMLCAVDDRPRVSVPVVIVGTTRQGGCTCEHAYGFRLGTYNLEFTALHAPKPLLLISADDSTRDMPERGFPELQRLYQLLGAEQNVALRAHLHFPHNYNAVSRTDMYHWVNRHLELGLEEPIEEKPYRRLTTAEMTVWNEDHPAPDGGKEFERSLLASLAADSDRQLAELRPHDAESLQRFREIVGTGWKEILRGDLPASVRFESRRHEGDLELGLLRYESVERHHAELPLAIVRPAQPSDKVVVWIDGAGKRALFDADGQPNRSARELTDSGHTVIGVDLLHQGGFLADGEPVRRNRSLPNEEAFAGWTYCYNLPVFARRVHDVLATVSLAHELASDGKQNKVALLGLNGAGPIAAAALSIAGTRVHRAAIDTGGFRFETLRDIYGVDFLPGSVKYLDLPGALALAAPVELMLGGEDRRSAALVHSAYEAASARERFQFYDGDEADLRASFVSFLVAP